MMSKSLSRSFRYAPVFLGVMFLVSLSVFSGGCERESSDHSGHDHDHDHDSGGIEWSTNYQTGLQQAKQENKAVLMVFSASWCPPCKEMKKTTYKNSDVKQLVESKFVPIYLDSDKETALAEKFNVQGIPAYYVLKSDGSQVKSFIGYHDAEEFSAVLNDSLGNF